MVEQILVQFLQMTDADLFIIDDGAGGTNRCIASRIKTYVGASSGGFAHIII